MKNGDDLDPLLDTGADYVMCVVDRADVEAGNIEATMAVLTRLLRDRDSVERFRNRVTIRFAGYDQDPRELHQIEEVRSFATSLDAEFPFWFYFMDLSDDMLIVLSLMLCRYVQDPFGGYTREQSDWEKFFDRHATAMDWLFGEFGLDEAEHITRANQIGGFFQRKRRPMVIN